MVIDNEKEQLKNLKSTFNFIKECLDPAKTENFIKDLKAKQESEDFWKDNEQVSKVGKQLRIYEDKIEKVNNFEEEISNIDVLIEMIEMGNEAENKELYVELTNNLNKLEKELDKTRLETLLNGKYDSNNAIVTIHAGAGGTEAQDWANMLYRMYNMFCEKEGYKTSVLNILDGDEVGIKGITFLVEGEYVYGYLKCEKGVHRLVRISPFDANSRRHTSFASVEVVPEIEESPDIVIRPEDLKIDTYRSSGAGGQHVNKTDSAIRITHIPSGIIATCQQERSQIQNREVCMKMVLSKLVERQEEQELDKLNKIRGDLKAIEWGSQIRSYVFHPYSMVKDHRTNYETSDVYGVMDGDVEPFISEYLRKSTNG
ncbi:MAG: peptide chain release factor 2 [Clostridia bacterium]|nr:peptide chain release factor 2 [Clostridia bacterium]